MQLNIECITIETDDWWDNENKGKMSNITEYNRYSTPPPRRPELAHECRDCHLGGLQGVYNTLESLKDDELRNDPDLLGLR